MNKTGIEYLTHTWNPMHGCSPISPGCRNCWAQGMAKRLAGMGAKGYEPSDPFKVTLHPDRLDEPLAVKKPGRIGVSFMGDLFHKDVPFTFILSVFNTMGAANQHTFLILTKRPERMKDFFEWWGFEEPLSNVWLGVTAENQGMADKRIPILLRIPAAKRFVSVEPLLGPVNISLIPDAFYDAGMPVPWQRLEGGGIDWVICGGESGPGARPCHPEWVRGLRGQCHEGQTPFMFKQWGEFKPGSDFLKDYVIIDIQGNVFDPGHVPADNHGRLAAMRKVGKRKAGRVLDYEEHMAVPA